jgi:ABC-2 type transport system permease protein
VNSFAGTGSLIRLALRRDRLILPVWIGIFVAMAASSAFAVSDLYATTTSRIAAVRSINDSPAIVALYGRVYSDSLGSVSLIKMSGLGAAMLAVLAFLLVVRHTRAEEASGRLELVGATAVGRYSMLTSALFVAMMTSVAIGALSALSLIAAGLPVAGSAAFGLAWTATGCAFAAVGGVTAQLTTAGRTATGLAAAFLGLAYLIRAVGDATGHNAASWFSWLSPIGWGQQVRPFADERWVVLLLLVAFTIAMTFVAFALNGRRDLGAGLLADRPGSPVASRWLSSPLGVSVRLERGTVIAWTAAIVLSGAIVGSIASQVGGMLDSPQAKDFIAKLGGTRALTDAYLAIVLSMFGVIVAVFGMQAVMRARNEETGNQAEAVLSTAVGRSRWLLSFVIVAMAGTGAILVVGGFASAVGNSAQTGTTSQFGSIFAGALVQIPAAWVMVGIVVAAFGLVPKMTKATWVLLVAFLLLGEFGPLINLPAWVMNISPFAHTPRMPGGVVGAGPLLELTAIAIALIAAGTMGFSRRDVG